MAAPSPRPATAAMPRRALLQLALALPLAAITASGTPHGVSLQEKLLVTLFPPAFAAEAAAGPFALPPLKYAYNALEPAIDEATMKVHHDAHFAAYVSNLNKALAGVPGAPGPGVMEDTAAAQKALAKLLKGLGRFDENTRGAVQNNGGGVLNHWIFFDDMVPGGRPFKDDSDLGKAVVGGWGSLDEFKKTVKDLGLKRFGSGWVWLYVDSKTNKLAMRSYPNQDNPAMEGHEVVMGIDLWEHAYYLKYKNKRGDYIDAWWSVVNWDAASDRYAAAMR